jgi:prepilin-type N-terminal cleavage/methylation domain-containing protein
MKLEFKQNAFSLTEVLMAVGILSIGIMLIATMFPAAIYLTTVASEKTMASIVADEAFAKMRIYGIQGSSMDPTGYDNYWWNMKNFIDPNEFIYPSLDGNGGKSQYSWAPLCKKLNDDSSDSRYLVKLYISRKTSPNQKFFTHGGMTATSDMPIPITADVNVGADWDRLKVKWGAQDFINPPPSTSIIDYGSGRIFRVIAREGLNEIVLDRKWDNDIKDPNTVWFMPSSEMNGKPAGKNPDIDVFQKIIDFKR